MLRIQLLINRTHFVEYYATRLEELKHHQAVHTYEVGMLVLEQELGEMPERVCKPMGRVQHRYSLGAEALTIKVMQFVRKNK